MAAEYSIGTIKQLQARFRNANLFRPMHVSRYDVGDEIVYDATGVGDPSRGRVRLSILRFAGGGFAGQVYQVEVLALEDQDGSIEGIRVGGIYAMKILIPPSAFSRLFRNVLYWLGFQGPFQLQVNPAAARAGALWQKFIRRGAAIRLGNENAVVDILATFVDHTLGSCGELSEWVDGRTWRLEVDDRLDWLKHWRRGKPVETRRLGSPEYRAKYRFMHTFVDLLHDMGGHEFARQYEWGTCKSQPNCLKRDDAGDDPAGGLVAVDFRAGLALLPFLPMSPGDISLVISGISRGSLVQFDRGSIPRLERFIGEHLDEFADMHEMLADLKACEAVYRDSVPDISHNHFRLLYSRPLWSAILGGAVTGWRVRNLVDDRCERRLRESRSLVLFFVVIGFLPFLGKTFRRMVGRPDWRKHYGKMWSSWDYLKRAARSRAIEKAIVWHRDGRVAGQNALRVPDSARRFMAHLPLSVLPAGIHRFLTDSVYARQKLVFLFVRPIRLYFNAELREQWLRDMVDEGRSKHILSEEDAEVIRSQVGEPFIQKYLKCLAVHVCTLPVTQVVSMVVALAFVWMNPEMPRAKAWGIGLGIIAAFQVVPVSPGSLVRGLYVLFLVIKERNFRDYNIAVFLGFFKYIGYLAFPIQMAYRYPVLARFMAGHWARESVHVVPVFGESGALLEHGVFRLFYNWPLTIWRRIRARLEMRASLAPRYWHIPACAIAAAGIWGIAEGVYLRQFGLPPDLGDVWWLSVALPMGCGSIVALGGRGASLWSRLVGSVFAGMAVGILSTGVSAVFCHIAGASPDDAMNSVIWRSFLFSILSMVGAIVTELQIPDPELEGRASTPLPRRSV